mmetsp:Transcript_21754/g.51633  ORF Transcript_21754/g.51633 Transcript_21754/m.51633 type:complete len:122 (+) Transcript_21754:156-521(+)
MASFRSSGSGASSSVYAEGTPNEIARCKIKTISCQGCHVRLGIPDTGGKGQAPEFLRCSFCGESTNVLETQQREKQFPPKMPAVGSVSKCTRCHKFVGVPRKVSTFQCGYCKTVNVAGALN